MAQIFKSTNLLVLKFFLGIIFIALHFSPYRLKAQSEATKPLDSSSLGKFEAFYQFQTNKGLYLQIQAEGKQLKLIQLWDYKEFLLKQTSELDFERDPGFKVTFSKSSEGAIESCLVNGRDLWLKDNAYKLEIIEELNPPQIEALKVTLNNTAEALINALNSNSSIKIQSFIKTYVSEALIKSEGVDFVTQLKTLYRLTGGVEPSKSISFTPKAALSEYQAKGKYLKNIYEFVISLDKQGKIKLFNNRLLPGPPPYSLPKGDKDLVQNIKTTLNALINKDLFSGTFLLAKNDKVLFELACGEADKEGNKKININTRFNLGSINKMFTALSIMQLAEKGKLDLKDPVSKFVDTTWLPKAIADKTTIHHLLSHSSGMDDFFTNEYEKIGKSSVFALEMAKPFVKTNKLKFEPGKDWRYSNSGMFLLGVVIERVSGLNYYDYIIRNIYKPAGMNSSISFASANNLPLNVAIGYIPTEDSYKSNRYSAYAVGTPAGGGYSTVHDLHKFALALDGDKLVSASSKQKMFTDYMGKQYGYGFQVFRYKDHTIIGHAGGGPGINAVVYMEQKSGYIMVILGNYDNTVRGISDFVLNRIKVNLD